MMTADGHLREAPKSVTAPPPSAQIVVPVTLTQSHSSQRTGVVLAAAPSGEPGPRGIPGSRWIVLGLATLAAVATWIATRHGPGMSPDSVTYLSAARNLAAGRGYTDFTGQALTTFPPGFPALVALGHVLGASLATAARIVNAASFGAIVVLAWFLVRRHVASPVVALGATALVAISPALINVSSNAWSEPLFCALVLAFLLALEDATVPGGRQARSIAITGVLAGLAVLVRYAGLSLLIVGSLALVAATWREGSRLVIRRLAQFWAVGLVLPAAWMVRNATSGTRFLLGPRVAAPASWSSFLGRFASSVNNLLAPHDLTTATVTGAVVLGLGGLGAAFARRRRPARPIPRVRSVAVLAIYLTVYSVVVVVSGKIAGASVDPRIVTPGYVPALILVAVVADLAVVSLTRPTARRMALMPAVALLVALAFVFASSAGSFVSQTWSDGRTARGYTPQSGDQFELVRRVEALTPGALVATNRPWTLFESTGRQPIVPSPGVIQPELALTPIPVAQLAAQACTRPVYLAWFTVAAQWPYTPSQLAGHLQLDPLQQVGGGVLYSVRPGGPDPDCPVASKHRPARDRNAS
jgi:4-amino-4-deoxy-L-arabinose transferase-like glycosyltransferase